MAKKKRGIMDWITIACWSAGVLTAILAYRLKSGDAPSFALLLLGFQFIVFARTMINTAIINGALAELQYDKRVYRKIYLPPLVRKLFYGYDNTNGIYCIVFVMQCLDVINLLACIVYAGMFVWNYLGSMNSLFAEKYHPWGITIALVSLCFHVLIGIYLIYLVIRLEKKHDPMRKKK